MSTISSAEPSPTLAPLEVKSTRYNLARLGLAQVLIPIGMILTPFARRSESWIGFGAALMIAATALWLLASARTTGRKTLSVQHGRLKLAHHSIRPGEFGRWRWLGDRAKLFLLDGTVVLEPTAPGDVSALAAMLRAELGAPLAYVRRGSAMTRGIAAGTLVLGAVLTGGGFAQHSLIAPVGIVVVVLGGAALGTLSQSVVVRETTPSQRGESPSSPSR
ncbi:MAG: hypothetical protein ABI548_26335 [Polyangiaceae bacterium]